MVSPLVIISTALSISLGICRALAKSFVVPAGIIPSLGLYSCSARPFTTSLMVPSPPAATTRSYFLSTAVLAAAVASPSPVVA